MSGNKSIYTKSMPVVAALALCLMASVSLAQTPAQDEANVTRDQKAVDDAQALVKTDTAQLVADQTAKNSAAAKADQNTLLADRLAETAAENKLKADMDQQSSDSDRFNGPAQVTPAPGASPATGTGATGTGAAAAGTGAAAPGAGANTGAPTHPTPSLSPPPVTAPATAAPQ